jgi:hypothetical protein
MSACEDLPEEEPNGSAKGVIGWGRVIAVTAACVAIDLVAVFFGVFFLVAFSLSRCGEDVNAELSCSSSGVHATDFLRAAVPVTLAAFVVMVPVIAFAVRQFSVGTSRTLACAGAFLAVPYVWVLSTWLVSGAGSSVGTAQMLAAITASACVVASAMYLRHAARP